VIDEGFCSLENIDLMYPIKMRFMISMTKSLNFTKSAVEEAKETIVRFSNYLTIMDSSLYVSSSIKGWNGHRCYTHIYYNETKRDTTADGS